MNNNRTIKKIFNTKSDGVRSVGRTKLRWEDGADQDMRISGVKNWKKFALKREEWAELLKEGQGPPRAVEPMMMMMQKLANVPCRPNESHCHFL
jgi:hypothetical protein